MRSVAFGAVEDVPLRSLTLSSPQKLYPDALNLYSDYLAYVGHLAPDEAIDGVDEVQLR